MNRLLALAIVAAATFAVTFSVNYLTTSVRFNGNPDYRFETIEGKCIATDGKNIYVLEINKSLPPIPHIRANSWNLTLNESLWISNVLKCFNGNIYAAGVNVVKIRNGKIEWMENLMVKRVSYERPKKNPIPVYYEDILNVFDMESDSKYLYINTRDGIVKTDENLNVIWAVELRENENRFGDLNDDISVSDGIYATRWNHIVKLNRDGELEWAVALASPEKVEQRIEKKDINKKGEIVQVERSRKVPKYSIEIYAVYAEDYVYVVGLAHELLNNQDYPFLAKLSSDGEIVWARIVNVTYPTPGTYELEGKIIRDETTFIAWFSNCILFTFDEDGKILNFYILNGEIEDIALTNNTIYIAALPIQVERIEDQKPVIVEKREVKVEKIPAVSIPISIKAMKHELKVKRIECYSKNWEKEERILIPR